MPNMKIIVNNIILKPGEDESRLFEKLLKTLRVKEKDIVNYKTIKKSIDARNKNNILFVYSLLVELSRTRDFSKNHDVKPYTECEMLEIPKLKSSKRPVVVGFGPAGMFAGLYLARSGLRPIIIERGKSIEERIEDVRAFKERTVFSEESNVCFGEGGAGTFSDGKLTTGISDSRIRFVLNEFISHGAPEEIYYEAHPHIGSDKLRGVVKSIREEIKALGGEVLFRHRLIDIGVEKNNVKSAVIINDIGEIQKIETDDLILAIGHSARDTFEMLLKNNIKMEPKPFSVGVRVEMSQEQLNRDQYGENYDGKLPPAEYKVSTHLENGRGVYSFCMCPGGEVVASGTEEGTVLVNGMSYFKRDFDNANSALLVSVNIGDYYKDSPLDGMYFQRELEKRAFNNEHPYYAPVQLLGDFLDDKMSENFGKIKPSYMPGTYFARLDDILPRFVCDSLRLGIPLLSKKLRTLSCRENVLTGVETRSSSPVKIPRDERGYSSVDGIYPCGEGASYAGGIMSAAIDGLRICECIKNKYI